MEMNNRAIVELFYAKHEDATDFADVWFDKWSLIWDIIKAWDDDCINDEYDELCDYFEDEDKFLKWVKENKNDDWETFSEVYSKDLALKEFTLAKKQAKKYAIEDAIRERELAYMNKPISVLDTVTGNTFLFANSYDKESFFDTWDKLVVSVNGGTK